MSALTEAREAVRELEARQHNLAIDIAIAKAARVGPEKRAAANNARRAKRQVVTNAGNDIRLRPMVEIRVEGYSARLLAGKKPKEIGEAIATGAVKIGFGNSYGASYTARGLSQRIRVPLSGDLHAWTKTRKAREAAEARLSHAKTLEAAAAAACFEHGTKIPLDELLADVTHAAVLTVALEALPRPGEKEHQLNRLVDGQFGELTIAQRHLDHLAGKKDAISPASCPTCMQLVVRAQKRDELRARVTALPRRKFTCPTHGPKLGHFERSERSEWITLNDNTRQWRANVPLIWCPVDLVRFIHATELAADLTKEAKPKPAKKQGKVIRFVCPNPECGEDSDSVIDPNGWIICEVCGSEWEAAKVKLVKKVA